MQRNSPRVVLINSNRMKPPIAPIGLDYVGTALEDQGYDVLLADLNFVQDIGKELDSALEQEPLAVGVSVRNIDDSYLASSAFFLDEVKDLVAQIRARTSAPIIFGGVGFSIAPTEALRYCEGDYAIRGDGEQVLPQLLHCIEHNLEPSGIAGVVFRSDGTVHPGLPPAFFELNRYPLSSRSLVDNARYFREGGQANIESKRGCPCGCVYCADPISKGRRQRLRNPSMVVAEIRALLQQGCDCLHFCDCEFNVPTHHAAQLCQAILDEGLSERISWYCYAIPLGMDRELVSLMKRAGCRGINFGVDHTVDSMLERLGREFRKTDVARVVECCKSEGVAVMLDLLLGAPGETVETVKETLGFIKNLEPDCVGVNAGIRIYAGTPFAQELLRSGSLENNPNVLGATADNPGLLRPVFYLDAEIRGKLGGVMADVLGDDPRFFIGTNEPVDSNYNYNDNALLVEAIQKGARGAYWDILRQMRRERASHP